MTAIVNLDGTHNNEHRVLCKGAPETIRTLLKDIPKNYDQSYLTFAKNGARVLALSYKILPKLDSYYTLTREESESDLIFCGFLISECPLKPDTGKIIKELVRSSHMVKMITGDNVLTAAYIGKEL
jgi:manganese-transporting P-type ATPase